MNEREWLAGSSAVAMIEYACASLGATRKHAGRRRLILFACACMRRMLQEVPISPLREAIELAESHADIPQTEKMLAVQRDLFQRQLREDAVYGQVPKGRFISIDTRIWFLLRAENLRKNVCVIVRGPDAGAWQADLLRDIFGNPFRPAVLEPSCVRWNDFTLARTAQAIYEERGFDRLPSLGDALKEAGCRDDTLLAHCRVTELSEHVRGCWIVDLLRTKGGVA